WVASRETPDFANTRLRARVVRDGGALPWFVPTALDQEGGVVDLPIPYRAIRAATAIALGPDRIAIVWDHASAPTGRLKLLLLNRMLTAIGDPMVLAENQDSGTAAQQKSVVAAFDGHEI